jgi:hypothetical protein
MNGRLILAEGEEARYKIKLFLLRLETQCERSMGMALRGHLEVGQEDG